MRTESRERGLRRNRSEDVPPKFPEDESNVAIPSKMSTRWTSSVKSQLETVTVAS